MMKIWVRAETKENEQRTLSPKCCAKLLEHGFSITVERCDQRIFKDSEYEELNLEMVPKGSWKTAPKDTIIFGLKELPEEDFPLVHTHIMFAHCYKQQDGWKDILNRFKAGNGLLLDLEFLQIDDEKSNRLPKLMVMGALGRCGGGACDFAERVGLPTSNIVRWDMKETAKGGPFEEILECDIFVNCIYLSKPIPPFLTKEMLNQPKKLSVVCDVSCDATNPHNPIPIYYGATTFDNPVIRVNAQGGNVDVIAIDHLPTLLPREASEKFCDDLLPTLLALKDRKNSQVWKDAEALYLEKSNF